MYYFCDLIRERENQKSWVIELFIKQGLAIYEINEIDFSVDNIQEMKKIYQSLEKLLSTSIAKKYNKSNFKNKSGVMPKFNCALDLKVFVKLLSIDKSLTN